MNFKKIFSEQNLNKIFNLKIFKIFIAILLIFVIILGIFKLGEFVGFRKANFSYRWGENYHNNFGGPRGGFLGNLPERDFINGHGIFGPVLKIDDKILMIKDKDNTEKTVIVSDQTIIQKGRLSIKISDIKVDDKITVIGSPNEQGQIEAKFIRMFGSENLKDLNIPFGPGLGGPKPFGPVDQLPVR